jgi:hypothetical protein
VLKTRSKLLLLKNEKKKMAADAPKKPKVNPLPQLYREAAWAIKWVAPGLYDTLTAPGVDEGAKRARLIEFFQDQGTEQNVVLKESEGGGAARESVLNDAGKGILETLTGMSKPEAVRADRGAQRTQRIEEEKRAAEEVWKSYARLLSGDYTDTTQGQMKAVRDITSIKAIDSAAFENYKRLEELADAELAKVALPSFDNQIALFEKLYEGGADQYKKLLFAALRKLDRKNHESAYTKITGDDTLPVLDADQGATVKGTFAPKVATVYLQSLPQNVDLDDDYF